MTEKTTKRQSRIRPEPDSDFLDVKQAAQYTGLGVRTLRITDGYPPTASAGP
jgi:hypothetical protein